MSDKKDRTTQTAPLPLNEDYQESGKKFEDDPAPDQKKSKKGK